MDGSLLSESVSVPATLNKPFGGSSSCWIGLAFVGVTLKVAARSNKNRQARLTALGDLFNIVILTPEAWNRGARRVHAYRNLPD
jgi:hypothetical protein